MHVIKATNVNDALAKGIRYLVKYGIVEGSRNGTVLVAPGPVTTVYSKPWQRVLFSPMRDANPFFHLMESLWMLGGGNELAFPAQFAKQLMAYSDDGHTGWGAYGWRWRNFFGWDQLDVAVEELGRNPNSRRVVLAMWNAMSSFTNHPAQPYAFLHGRYAYNDMDVAIEGGKDVPCNTHIYLDCRGGVLNMTVCNRSNDIWWGCYGANAVHMSVLQEYVAQRLGIEMGEYRQISNNYHIYTNVVPYLHPLDVPQVDKLLLDIGQHNLYSEVPAQRYDQPTGELIFTHYGLGATSKDWDRSLQEFLKYPEQSLPANQDHPFFAEVARPMYRAWVARKDGDIFAAYKHIQQIKAEDWRAVCQAWVYRREVRKQEAALA